ELFDALEPALQRGVPVIGLEPACIAAFRDEAIALYPNDQRARRLKEQSFLLSEFLEKECGDSPLPNLLGRRALVQVHSHHHAVLAPAAERQLLERLGLEVEIMPTGCCGMAGSFGFEAEKYPWSMKIAERALLPKLREAPADAVVLANGFSCREQIEQG